MSKKGNEEDKVLTDNELAAVAGGRNEIRYVAYCKTCGWSSDTSYSPVTASQAAEQHRTQFVGHEVNVIELRSYDPNAKV